MSGPVKVCVVGAGKISEQYLANMKTYPDLDVCFLADLNTDLARARADEFGVPSSGTVDEALARDDVELVVNLTIPAAHASVAAAAMASGKHVWNEKPLAADPDAGRELVGQAGSAGVLLGCAPDTFLGPGLQTCRQMIERGDIGEPLTALIVFQNAGPHLWHPNPDFLFQPGGGPLFDMAPYYLTALAQIFGPVARVAAVGTSSGPTRTIGEGPRAGQSIDVTVPTHVSAIYEFVGGLKAQATFSFDTALPRIGLLEINGTNATIATPDPNHFDGEITVSRTEWPDVVTTTRVVPKGPAGRGIGAVDMARSIRTGGGYGPHRATGALGLHVLDSMYATGQSIDTATFVPITSTFPPVPALPPDWDPTERTV